MIKQIFLLAIIVFSFIAPVGAQNNPLLSIADSLYKVKDFKQSATAYLVATDSAKQNGDRKRACYNAACCFALTGDTA
ncbi:MAG TPA: hypothetical protein VF610_04120, partial [Segetibacter sp.]